MLRHFKLVLELITAGLLIKGKLTTEVVTCSIPGTYNIKCCMRERESTIECQIIVHQSVLGKPDMLQV